MVTQRNDLPDFFRLEIIIRAGYRIAGGVGTERLTLLHSFLGCRSRHMRFGKGSFLRPLDRDGDDHDRQTTARSELPC